MSVYHEILELARTQSDAVARGDLDVAVRILEERSALLGRAPTPTRDDEDAIREVLRRDRDLSGAIRERMLDIRARSLKLQQGRVALTGYHTPRQHQLGLVDATR